MSILANIQNTGINSGKTRSTSNQPAFIVPSGSGLTATISCASTALSVNIDGTDYTFSSDISITGLTAAASSSNTCLMNAPLGTRVAASAQADTRLWGEDWHFYDLAIDNAGSEITTTGLGKYCAFKLVNSTPATEYFIGRIDSSTSIKDCMRGYFYDSSSNPVNRIVFSDNNTVTILRINWIFIKTDGTTDNYASNVYATPTWSSTAPTGPSSGDRWFDITNRTWKKYNGSSWVANNAVLIGMVICDTTNAIAARSFDFSRVFDPKNGIEIEYASASTLRSVGNNKSISVYGKDLFFGNKLITWDMTANLATSVDMYTSSEQANTNYYFYLKDDGDPVISDIEPYPRKDLHGFYHPHNPWRCVGVAFNGSGSDFSSDNTRLESISNPNVILQSVNLQATASTNTRIWYAAGISADSAAVTGSTASTTGLVFTIKTPGYYSIIMGIGHANQGEFTRLHFDDSFAELSTNSSSCTGFSINPNTIIIQQTAAAGPMYCCSPTVFLKRGQMIRAHAEGAYSPAAGAYGGSLLWVHKVRSMEL